MAHRLRSQAGFTLVEVLVAMTVMLIGTFAAVSLIDRANAATTNTKAREAGTSLVRELVESVRGVPYDRLTDASLLAELSTQPGLADSAAGTPYTLTRRDVAFTVTGTVCVMDDPRDGGGLQTGGGFCPGSAAPSAPLDSNPEDYKRAAITVSWTRNGLTRSITQTAIVNNPGAAGAPAVQSIAPTNTVLPVTNPLTASISFEIVTSSAADSVNWLLDGGARTPAPTPDADRKRWTAVWDLTGVIDGTYIVAAEAFDRYGVSGPTRQVPVQINRNEPNPPVNASGGRTSYGDVEIEWAGSAERDIIGYEVRRGTEVVCARAAVGMGTSCRDTSPPDEADGNVEYTVYAFDTAPGGGARPSAGTPVTVISGNVAPFAPRSVRAGSDATLKWQRPVPDDPGPEGDAIAYYRVYRDGRGYANRYARWHDDRSTVSWTDPEADGQSHTYWVTSVDTNYRESEPAGGVLIP